MLTTQAVFCNTYFEIALKIHRATRFDTLVEVMSEDVPSLIGGSHGLIFGVQEGRKVRGIHGPFTLVSELESHISIIESLLEATPLTDRLDVTGEAELGIPIRDYFEIDRFQEVDALREICNRHGFQDALVGVISNIHHRANLALVLKNGARFTAEEKATFDALLLGARLKAEVLGTMNNRRQLTAFYQQHSPHSDKAFFMVERETSVLPINHCAVRFSESYWPVDDPTFTLSERDVEALHQVTLGAWCSPLCTCFGEVEVDLGAGLQVFHALPSWEGRIYLILPLAGREEDAEAAIHAILTRRQREIMEWIAEGKTSSETAIILDISPRTVEKHLEAVFQRLGVENRITAVRRFLEMKAGHSV
ncbi:MAG: response regulator transcription factor [Verrucomicrobiales bacterium]